MSHPVNEQMFEDAKEAFYLAIDAQDFNECDQIISMLNSMNVDTKVLERELATAQSDSDANKEPDDFSNSKIEDYGL